MQTQTQMNTTEQLYKFRGKKFLCDEYTIRQLNYALALNRSQERYELVKTQNARK